MIDESTLQDEGAELRLIGALACDPHAIAETVQRLPGSDFYHFNRGRVWDAARALLDDNRLVQTGTLLQQLSSTDELDAGTRHVLQQDMVIHLSGADLMRTSQLADLVSDAARRRDLARVVKRAAQMVRERFDDPAAITAEVLSEFETLAARQEPRDDGTLSWPQLMDEFEAHHAEGVDVRGIETPWPELNDMLGNLRPGRFYVIGGSTNMGKSMVAMNMAAHAAARKESVLVFSKEMPTVDVTGRMVARGAEIDLRTINAQRLTDYDRGKVARLREETADYRLWVNSDPVTISAIRRITRRLHSRRGVDLLVVDYLQLMTGDERLRSREEEIARISTQLKELAMELKLAVVVPAQLNRGPSARPDQKPMISDLRESGRIEQDANAVILLWRPPIQVEGHPMNGQPDPDHITFIVDKNRDGPKGSVTLRWNGGYGVIS